MHTKISKARIAKLPTWAQEYIAEQDRLVAYWRDQARENDLGETGVSWGRFTVTGVMEWVPIPGDTVIRFGDAEKHFDAMLVQGKLDVRGSDSIVVAPRQSNGVFLVNVPHNWHEQG